MKVDRIVRTAELVEWQKILFYESIDSKIRALIGCYSLPTRKRNRVILIFNSWEKKIFLSFDFATKDKSYTTPNLSIASIINSRSS